MNIKKALSTNDSEQALKNLNGVPLSPRDWVAAGMAVLDLKLSAPLGCVRPYLLQKEMERRLGLIYELIDGRGVVSRLPGYEVFPPILNVGQVNMPTLDEQDWKDITRYNTVKFFDNSGQK